MFCVDCNTQLPDNANFCMKCGKRLKDGRNCQHQPEQSQICEIHIVKGHKRSGLFKRDCILDAVAIGPIGEYVVATVKAKIAARRVNLEEDPSFRVIRKSLVDHLVGDGWKPLESLVDGQGTSLPRFWK